MIQGVPERDFSGQACAVTEAPLISALAWSDRHEGATQLLSVGSGTTLWRPVAVLSVEVSSAWLPGATVFFCDPQIIFRSKRRVGSTSPCQTLFHLQRDTIWVHLAGAGVSSSMRCEFLCLICLFVCPLFAQRLQFHLRTAGKVFCSYSNVFFCIWGDCGPLH